MANGAEPLGRGPLPHSRLRRAVYAVLLAVVGIVLGAVLSELWRRGWFADWNWTAVTAIATFAAVATALAPMWREERRRRRQADVLRFRLWIHFSKLHWLLTHLAEHDPTKPFFSPGLGGEELTGIEVLMAQAHMLELDQYDWVIFTVNLALPSYGRPLRDVATGAPRLLWAIDATLERLGQGR